MHGYKWPINCTRTRGGRLGPSAKELAASRQKWMTRIAEGVGEHATILIADARRIRAEKMLAAERKLREEAEAELSASRNRAIETSRNQLLPEACT